MPRKLAPLQRSSLQPCAAHHHNQITGLTGVLVLYYQYYRVVLVPVPLLPWSHKVTYTVLVQLQLCYLLLLQLQTPIQSIHHYWTISLVSVTRRIELVTRHSVPSQSAPEFTYCVSVLQFSNYITS